MERILFIALFFISCSAFSQTRFINSAPSFAFSKPSYIPLKNVRTTDMVRPITGTVHYTAFFCKLECKMHDNLNIWVKFRAGTDESYRKFSVIH